MHEQKTYHEGNAAECAAITRRLHALSGACFLGTLAACVLAIARPEAAVDEEVRAHAFVLVDDEGQPRAALAMRPDGTPALAFTGPDGNITWKAP